MKLLSIGDNVIDFYSQSNKFYVGGNSVNVSVFGKKFGAEYSSYIGILGLDSEGDRIFTELKAQGIDVSRVRWAYGETGRSDVLLKNGEREFVGGNQGGVQSALTLKINPADSEFMKNHDIIHSSVYSGLESKLPQISEFGQVSFDFSTKISKDYLKKVCPFINFAFFSGKGLKNKEITSLSNFVQSLGVYNVVITLGEEGAIYSNKKDKLYFPSKKIKAVDTLGAGDAFIATFLVHYFKQGKVKEAMEKAIINSSEVCKIEGAFQK